MHTVKVRRLSKTPNELIACKGGVWQYTLDGLTYMGVEVEAASYESLANSLKHHEHPGRTQGRNAPNRELVYIRMEWMHKVRVSQ